MPEKIKDRTLEVVKELKSIEKAVTNARFSKVHLEYVAPDGASNEESELHFQMHKAMAEHLAAKRITAIAKVRYDEAGKALDEAAKKLNLNVEVAPGGIATVYSDDFFSYIKKVNKSSETVDMAEFRIALARAGVPQSKISQAELAATKKRTPATYREISIEGTTEDI